MLIGNVDLSKEVMVIAEVGNNHEGSYGLAEELIGRAAESGAQAVKFQTIRPEHLVSSDQTERLGRLSKFALSYEQFASLARLADKSGVVFLSTPFDLESAEFLNTICPAIKIASGDNTFLPLIDRVASFAKPIILSCGLASAAELNRPVTTVQSRWRSMNHDGDLVLLHSVASYPTPAAEANLGAIKTLAMTFDCTVGYSDHTIGIDAAVLSVALGARVIEKHFTIDKNYSDFRDHQLSADPSDMKELVVRVRHAYEMLGTGEKQAQPSEAGNETAFRRSIAASANLAAGTVLRGEHLTWVRPGSGLPPGEEASVLGRALKRAYRMGEILNRDDIGPVS